MIREPVTGCQNHSQFCVFPWPFAERGGSPGHGETAHDIPDLGNDIFRLAWLGFGPVGPHDDVTVAIWCIVERGPG